MISFLVDITMIIMIFLILLMKLEDYRVKKNNFKKVSILKQNDSKFERFSKIEENIRGGKNA